MLFFLSLSSTSLSVNKRVLNLPFHSLCFATQGMKRTKLEGLTEQAFVKIKLHESVHDADSLNQWKTEMFTLINAMVELKLPSSPKGAQEGSSLDPVDWPSARSLAHQMLDSSLDYMQYLRDRPVRQWAPCDVRMALENEPLPEQGQPLSAVCDDVLKYVIPYARGNAHPRFWGWVVGEGTLGGVIGDMVSAALNMNACDTDHSAAFVERAVIKWMRQVFSFPEDSTGGLLVSGTSIATVISMATARQRVLVNVREDGLVNEHQLIAYASTETHGCVVKALELLGLGSKALHLVPVDENFRIKTPELKAAIRNDRQKGLIPFCIVGNAGKYNDQSYISLSRYSF
jgi:aromatic-L-amino-acid decarboxylase